MCVAVADNEPYFQGIVLCSLGSDREGRAALMDYCITNDIDLLCRLKNDDHDKIHPNQLYQMYS